LTYLELRTTSPNDEHFASSGIPSRARSRKLADVYTLPPPGNKAYGIYTKYFDKPWASLNGIFKNIKEINSAREAIHDAGELQKATQDIIDEVNTVRQKFFLPEEVTVEEFEAYLSAKGQELRAAQGK
jgi:hypothetical protein